MRGCGQRTGILAADSNPDKGILVASKVDQRTIAAALRELAALMELNGANPFKVRAHEAAVRSVESEEFDVLAAVKEGTLGDHKGFGEKLVAKVTELVETGKMTELEELRAETPAGLLEMLDIPGLGPKKAQTVWKKLDITTVDDLEKACREHRLKDLSGFGAKTEEKILQGIQQMRSHAGRYHWAVAWKRAEALLAALRKMKAVQRVEVAGSLRRRREVVKDIDIVCSTESPEKVGEAFTKLDGVEEIIGSGDTKVSVRLAGGIACDLRLVSDAQFPFTLAHFTGSKEHNVAMRGRAQKMFNIRVSEYGLFDESKDDKLIACRDEAAIHRRLGLAHMPPEIREDMGEIAAAEKDDLPDLVEEKDIAGVLHMHTKYSDGKETVATMAKASAERGFKWIGISDHSVTAGYAGGMKPDAVKRQFDEIDKLNAGDSPVTIFKGIEVDILPNGDVDYDESIWKLTDFLIASVHSNFTLPEKEMTERVCRALENPHVTVLGHPTGRLLLSREPYAIDLEAVIEHAAKHGRLIEINANPRRLDLDWRWVRRARDAGIMLSIGPDAHRISMLDDTWGGVGIARKGWLTRDDLLNCKSAAQVKKVFAKTRGD